LSNCTLSFSFWLDLCSTYNNCVIQLATTDNKTNQNAVIDFGFQLVKSTFGNKTNKVITNIIIWLTLANINPILRSFILQNNCSGSCSIHAAIKLAEKIIPNGIHRIRYGFDVYAGKKYAIIIATK